MKHHCHAHKCTIETGPSLFMCPFHWRMLPSVYQEAILMAYKSGQERTKTPSPEYMKAAHSAKLCLAEREYPEDVDGLRRLYSRIDAYYDKQIAARNV